MCKNIKINYFFLADERKRQHAINIAVFGGEQFEEHNKNMENWPKWKIQRKYSKNNEKSSIVF